MSDKEHGSGRTEVEYYLLDGQDLARAYYNPNTDEYVEGEILCGSGRWEGFPTGSIITDGEQISKTEAKEWIEKNEPAIVEGSFLDLGPELSDPHTARCAILPIPYEGTVSYKAGTAAGPAAIIEASAHVEYFDTELGAEFHRCGVATFPPVSPAAEPSEQMARVKAAAGPVLASGKLLIALGGEHSITVPLIQAAIETHGPLSVLQIDAHADLRDSYQGSRHSHACVMRRVLEMTDSICQVGIRSLSIGEYRDCPDQAANFITPEMILRDDAWTDNVLARLTDNVYVTIDMDGFDPSIAPGVGTPEPGGLSWQQVTSLLKRVCTERKVVGADIVETRPIPPNHITEFLAAKLACKIIAYTNASCR